MKLFSRRIGLILISALNLIVASCISHKIINQDILFILISAYAFVSETILVVRNKKAYKFARGFNIIAKILSVIGLFILTTNVFIFKNGEKPCDHCTIITVYWIVVGGLYIFYYIIYLLCTFLDAYIIANK